MHTETNGTGKNISWLHGALSMAKRRVLVEGSYCGVMPVPRVELCNQRVHMVREAF